MSIEKILQTLEKENQITTGWFKQKEVIVNRDKIQAIIVKRNPKMNDQFTFDIDGTRITSDKTVKLFSIDIPHKLSFDKYVSSLGKKANNQLIAISRLHRY